MPPSSPVSKEASPTPTLLSGLMQPQAHSSLKVQNVYSFVVFISGLSYDLQILVENDFLSTPKFT